jgi:hypothetical protein
MPSRQGATDDAILYSYFYISLFQPIAFAVSHSCEIPYFLEIDAVLFSLTLAPRQWVILKNAKDVLKKEKGPNEHHHINTGHSIDSV